MKHIHLIEVARARKLEANVYDSLWSDCVLTVTDSLLVIMISIIMLVVVMNLLILAMLIILWIPLLVSLKHRLMVFANQIELRKDMDT